ncbi:hypothetical protein [Mesorhizobium sp. M0910]|uniref:hypothetical protein n=1 Tax=Mesorhizobium sp. M0910 TaxID=2957025 RepID=UPI0033388BE0
MLDDTSQDKDRLAARLSAREPVFWTNPALVRSHDPGAYRGDIADAQGRLRGARYHLQVAFPGIGRSDFVESQLVAPEDLVKRWNATRWLVDADNSLPIAGSTKVREEISRPVLSAIEIIKVANDTNCGLASQLYTDNLTSPTVLLRQFPQEPCQSNAFLKATSPCCSAATRNLASRVGTRALPRTINTPNKGDLDPPSLTRLRSLLKAHVPWKQKDRPPCTGHSTRRLV